jgi:hypothetical protein
MDVGVDDAGQHGERAVVDESRTCRHLIPRGHAFDLAGGHGNGGGANPVGSYNALRTDHEVGHC